jgi:hypothetical protein
MAGIDQGHYPLAMTRNLRQYIHQAMFAVAITVIVALIFW